MIGIDPGKSGGMVLIDDANGSILDRASLENMTEHDMGECLREWAFENGQLRHRAIIERVHGGAPPGKKKGSAGAFHFGQNYGTLRGIMVGSLIPFSDVTPQKWQKALGCLTHGDKNVSKAAAQRRWPKEKWTHALADAALIAEYGRLQKD
jgi:hypothetical protein